MVSPQRASQSGLSRSARKVGADDTKHLATSVGPKYAQPVLPINPTVTAGFAMEAQRPASELGEFNQSDITFSVTRVGFRVRAPNVLA